jgi:hypothetical protein
MRPGSYKGPETPARTWQEVIGAPPLPSSRDGGADASSGGGISGGGISGGGESEIASGTKAVREVFLGNYNAEIMPMDELLGPRHILLIHHAIVAKLLLLTHSPIHSLTHSPTHTLTHSHTHPLTHSLTHSLTYYHIATTNQTSLHGSCGSCVWEGGSRDPARGLAKSCAPTCVTRVTTGFVSWRCERLRLPVTCLTWQGSVTRVKC